MVAVVLKVVAQATHVRYNWNARQARVGCWRAIPARLLQQGCVMQQRPPHSRGRSESEHIDGATRRRRLTYLLTAPIWVHSEAGLTEGAAVGPAWGRSHRTVTVSLT